MADFLKIERFGGVTVWTMNQPDTRNVLTGNSAVSEIVDACASAASDTSVRAIVLTGTDPAFSAGGNLRDMLRYQTERPSAGAVRDEYRNGIQRIPKALYNLDIPTVAAVNGPAIGAGLDLANMCDIRIASEKAKFAESFVKVGLVAGDGGAWLLPRIVGMSKACEMTFTGDTIDAAEALACGLVSRVVPHDVLMDQAITLANRIAANPGGVMRMTKRLLREADLASLETLLELSASYQAHAHQSEDHFEAVNAFLEKRTPRFSA
ncbi:crotonase/enoyl-CoA hydratase family protein [Paraburkholderia sediminicola]|uniref:crotonase/enoyl-CoA hydratase family protein n=1 Tax=Paraburkholderia sediminicola TaxID=458836 RepID=UPI000E759BDA